VHFSTLIVQVCTVVGFYDRELDLDNNQLSGSIPSTISSLTALT
jgi:hypothetical protein